MKKLSIIFISIITMLNLTSCSGFFSSPVSLMHPPKSSGDLAEIEETLSKIAPDYQLSYPNSGKFRNAVIIKDLNNDRINEAVVFYQTTKNKTITVHMNILTLRDGNWISNFDTALSGTGVDRIEFHDVCYGDETEIFVGSKLYNTNEQELNVFSYKENKVNSLITERYTDYLVGDIGASKKPQILIFKIEPKSDAVSHEAKDSPLVNQVSAKLLSLSYSKDGEAVTLGTAPFDNRVASFSSISVSKTEDDKNVVFLDAFVGDNSMITEVFYYEKTLKTTFYNKRAKTTDLTYRESLIGSRDIDFDGSYEIPKTYLCQGYDGVETEADRVYFTEWYDLNGKALDNKAISGFINNMDNYFVSTPAEWLGNVTAQRNTDLRERIFCDWDFTNKTFGETLFSIRVFLKSDFKNDNQGFTKINEDKEYIYAVKVNEDAKSEYKITVEQLKENIILL